MTGEMLTRCGEIMREVCEDFAVALKGVSSRYLRKEYDAHVRRYLWGSHFWSSSCFAGSCGGAPLTVVRQYIENQQHPE